MLVNLAKAISPVDCAEASLDAGASHRPIQIHMQTAPCSRVPETKATVSNLNHHGCRGRRSAVQCCLGGRRQRQAPAAMLAQHAGAPSDVRGSGPAVGAQQTPSVVQTRGGQVSQCVQHWLCRVRARCGIGALLTRTMLPPAQSACQCPTRLGMATPFAHPTTRKWWIGTWRL